MIVLEVPHRLPPKVWEFRDLADLRRIYRETDKSGRVAYEQTTARALLSGIGQVPEDVDPGNLTDENAWIYTLARYGWDMPVYRADYVYGEGVYSDDPIDELDALKAWIKHDLHAARFFKDADDAKNTHRIPAHQHNASIRALRAFLPVTP